MDILPPDNDTFHSSNKKPVSNKQKEHLARARVAAKATIERRRKLEAEALLTESSLPVAEPEVERPPSPKQDPDVGDEEDPEPPMLERQRPRGKVSRKTKTVELSEDEVELRRFEKFMKNMNTYESLKVRHAEEAEEAKKIKLTLTEDEYQQMLTLLENDDAKKAAAAEALANPVRAPAPIRNRIVKPLVSNRSLNRYGN